MNPHIPLLVGLLVGWSVNKSVIISQKGVKLPFHVSIRELVVYLESLLTVLALYENSVNRRIKRVIPTAQARMQAQIV